MQLNEGGWSREITVRDLPIAKTLAGVNMSLVPGGVRELHWHQQAEWAYMLLGSARVTAVDQNGRNFIADIEAGDLWYFPAGIPHSIQALENGCEFLLVFDDGNFSDLNTVITSYSIHYTKLYDYYSPCYHSDFLNYQGIHQFLYYDIHTFRYWQ